MEHKRFFIGVVVELHSGSWAYYYGERGHGTPEQSSTFSTEAEAEEDLHRHFEKFETEVKKEGAEAVKEIEYVKENPEEDTLSVLKNLFEF